MRNRAFSIVALVLSVGLALSLTDLYKVQQGALVVYATPALQSLLESFVVPQFRSETGLDVTLVYVSAGEQYNRLQMSGGHPEADVFLHASPLFVEKGFAAGYFLPFQITRSASVPPNFQSRNVTGGHLWYAFAWSPLLEVYSPTLGAAPDLAFINTSFGFPHPLLSNNGIYAVLFFENVSAAAGARALAHTVVQPVNARSNILGVADRAFDVTLGYEGVTLFYLNQGARVAFNLRSSAGNGSWCPSSSRPASSKVIRIRGLWTSSISCSAMRFNRTSAGSTSGRCFRDSPIQRAAFHSRPRGRSPSITTGCSGASWSRI